MVQPPKKIGEPRGEVSKYGRSVFFQDYQMPDGSVEEFFVSTANTTPAIGMPVTADSRVVLVRQYRYGIGDFILEFPGGGPRPGESLEDAFQREILEETGYECGKLTRLSGPIAHEPVWYSAKYVPFLATGCVFKEKPEREIEEIMELVAIPLPEFVDNVLRGNFLFDAKSLAIALLALPQLGYSIEKK